MKSREETIAFEMNYCQHYGRGKGAEMICKAGMDRKTIQCVPTGAKGIKWGPCIEGHTLENPHDYCSHWIRRTREMGEKRADAHEAMIRKFTVVMPVVNKWRTWSNSNRVSKQEVIECPECKGRLHLSQSSYNGHVHAHCETKGCVSWTVERTVGVESMYDMIEPIASDEGYLYVYRYKNPPEPPQCDECKDEGPEDGTSCKKCGYQRF